MQPKNRKLVYDAGTNDADYDVTKYETIWYDDGKQKLKQVWMCPYYRVWKDMLMRCYSAKLQERYPTYAECTVSNDWLTFSNLKNWMVQQNWKDSQLDKDLLSEGNKIYSADTCVFVTPLVNSFTTDSGATRGEWPIGVDWSKVSGKFRARCNNPFTGEKEYLGLFSCELEAHKAWRKRKLELAHELAAIQTDQRVAKALIDRYT